MPKENISKVVSVSLDSLVEESIKIKKIRTTNVMAKILCCYGRISIKKFKDI